MRFLPVIVHGLVWVTAMVIVLARGGPDAIWTTSTWSGHDGMQHFRVAVHPLPDRPITDNPIRYSRILYPLAAHLLGRAAAPLLPDRIEIPHLDGTYPGHFLGIAWSLALLSALFGLLVTHEAARALGRAGGILVALCPLLLLAELHCLDWPILAWGSFRFLRRWQEGASGRRLLPLAAALCLVHSAAVLLVAAWVVEPWLPGVRQDTRTSPSQQRLRHLVGGALAALPLCAWCLFLLGRPGFGAAAGAGEYGSAALAPWPFGGMTMGVVANAQALTSELSQGQWLAAGARVARHGLLLAATVLMIGFPWLARRGQEGKEEPATASRVHLAYWVPAVCLIAFADVQVAADLDNLGRLLFASPLCYLAWQGRRHAVWRQVMAVAVFLAVDFNYLHAFLAKVDAGGVDIALGRAWW